MIRIKYLPINKEVEVDSEDLYFYSSILDIAYAFDIDVPSSCQMGTCGTCMAKVEKGLDLISENFGNDSLSNDSNIVLTCISEIKEGVSEGEIVVNYDYSKKK